MTMAAIIPPLILGPLLPRVSYATGLGVDVLVGPGGIFEAIETVVAALMRMIND